MSHFFTRESHARTTEELRKLRQELIEVSRAKQAAAAEGDLSENAEYHAAKEAQGLNEARVAELEDRLSRAEVIDVSRLSGDTVKFGASVKLIDEDTEAEVTYRIVGEYEADIREGKISITSPIARALISKGVGDSVEVSTPGGGKSYEIVGVVVFEAGSGLLDGTPPVS